MSIVWSHCVTFRQYPQHTSRLTEVELADTPEDLVSIAQVPLLLHCHMWDSMDISVVLYRYLRM